MRNFPHVRGDQNSTPIILNPRQSALSNQQQFLGSSGLVSEARGLVHDSTLGSSVIKKKVRGDLAEDEVGVGGVGHEELVGFEERDHLQLLRLPSSSSLISSSLHSPVTLKPGMV